jgi:hypothetical protein
MQRIGWRAWPAAQWERNAARAILLLWAAFWVWFGLASGLSERLSPLGVAVHVAAPGLVFAVITAVAWRWERAAAWLLLAVAAGILYTYNELMGHRGPAFVLQVGSILAGPPLLAGLLFYLSWRSRLGR